MKRIFAGSLIAVSLAFALSLAHSLGLLSVMMIVSSLLIIGINFTGPAAKALPVVMS